MDFSGRIASWCHSLSSDQNLAVRMAAHTHTCTLPDFLHVLQFTFSWFSSRFMEPGSFMFCLFPWFRFYRFPKISIRPVMWRQLKDTTRRPGILPAREGEFRVREIAVMIYTIKVSMVQSRLWTEAGVCVRAALKRLTFSSGCLSEILHIADY